jgi:fluoride exporter
LKTILLIGAGGFIGSIARYYVSRLNNVFDFFSVPAGTLIVNVSGCLIIGLLTGLAEKSSIMTSPLKMFLIVGVCGGFTTFSTFAGESLVLMQGGQFLSVLLYAFLSLFLGFAAVSGGYYLTNIL